MKRIINKLIAILIIISFTIIPVSANTIDTIQPRWDNTSAVKANIAFSGTYGTYSANVVGDDDVTDIIAFAKLYYKNSSGSWVEIPMPWGFISTSPLLFIGERFDAQSGVEYKVELEIHVYVGYDEEVIHMTTTKTCP